MRDDAKGLSRRLDLFETFDNFAEASRVAAEIASVHDTECVCRRSGRTWQLLVDRDVAQWVDRHELGIEEELDGWDEAEDLAYESEQRAMAAQRDEQENGVSGVVQRWSSESYREIDLVTQELDRQALEAWDEENRS